MLEQLLPSPEISSRTMGKLRRSQMNSLFSILLGCFLGFVAMSQVLLWTRWVMRREPAIYGIFHIKIRLKETLYSFSVNFIQHVQVSWFLKKREQHKCCFSRYNSSCNDGLWEVARRTSRRLAQRLVSADVTGESGLLFTGTTRLESQLFYDIWFRTLYLFKTLRNFNLVNLIVCCIHSGIMTAQRYIDSRAVAIYETWGQTAPGGVLFFSSDGTVSWMPFLYSHCT